MNHVFSSLLVSPVSPSADSTGTHSLYTTYKDYEIMFHVSTMLPYTPNNKQQVCHLNVVFTLTHIFFGKENLNLIQTNKYLFCQFDSYLHFFFSDLMPHLLSFCFQLLRKRHIGNDIVTIVFQEPGALPFTPKNIRSHFQHVFVIVRAHNPCSDNSSYR